MENKIEPYLKNKLPVPTRYFYGRERELEEIHKTFQSGKHIMFLQGIGGIGKSELAKQYAVLYKEYYKTVVFAHCVSELKKLIIDDEEIPIAYITRDNTELEQYEEEEEYLERKLKALKKLEDENILIVIDDLNETEDIHLTTFLKLKYKILITSRADWSKLDYPYLVIRPLSNIEDIKKIFYTYYVKKQEEQEDDLITDIIKKVKGHTLTVEWLAKQMADGSICLKDMWQQLEDGNLAENTGTLEMFYEKLKDVFQISNLSEAEKDILRIMTLVPYTGITREDLVIRARRGCHAGVLKLMRNSWIENGEKMGYINLHPVIAEVVIRELKPNWKNCGYFIQNVKKDLVDTKLPGNKVERLFPVAMSIVENLGTEEPESISFMLDLAYALQFRKGEYRLAEYYAKRALRAQAALKEQVDKEVENRKRDVMDIHYNEMVTEQYNGEKRICMARNRLGCIYYEQKDYEKAMEQFKTLINYIPMTDPFCNIASCYQNLNNLDEALHYTKLGLAYQQKRFGEDNLHNFSYYKQFGMIYMQMGEEQEAIYYFEKAREIIEREIKEIDLYRAQFYSQYAAALKQLGQFAKALDLEKRALKIKISLLGKNHIEVAKSYASLAYCYYYLKDYENTLYATLEEMKVRKSIGEIKLNLYMSVMRLVPMLEEKMKTDEDLKQNIAGVVGELNGLLKKYPEKLQEIMSQ